MLETNEHLNSLKDKNEALRRNISEPDLTEQPRCPPPPASPPPPKAKSEIHLKKTPDWENYQERLYFFSTDESSWNESRRSCQDLGGDLVKIDSREEQVFLEIRLRSLMEEAEDRFWIGLTDAEEEGRWFWVDGSPLNESLSFWSNGEPNNHAGRTPAGEDCVRMGKKGGADDLKCWFDHSCDGLQKSICEKAKARPEPPHRIPPVHWDFLPGSFPCKHPFWICSPL
uniref:CD209 antigen-like n=1 Tax=Fundulus heteroclitus TaxID=8078 RepID=A0A3Q2QIP2_FUNHE